MPAEHIVVPREVAELVERYASEELADARKFENRSPLDETGVWSLHRLAAEIHAIGFAGGEWVAEIRDRGVRQREASRESGGPS